MAEEIRVFFLYGGGGDRMAWFSLVVSDRRRSTLDRRREGRFSVSGEAVSMSVSVSK